MPRKTETPVQEPVPVESRVAITSTQERAISLKAIASELVAARERAGLSISELHRRTGISRTVLQGYEKARFAPGTLELRKLCETMGISANRVVFGTETPLEKKSWLGGAITDLSKPMNIARITVILQTLTLAEQEAFLTLLGSISTARVGGEEEMRLAMEAIDAMFATVMEPGSDFDKIAQGIADKVPLEKLKDIEERAKELKKRKARRA
jgi:transcriptional regulator with XRE-family HTH domain